MGGRDDHNHNRNNVLAQTPKQQLSDGIDIEFSQELADADDLEAVKRSREADKRVKGRNTL
ncbi:YfhD family protein [Oceanobacillus piezotolerans]|uniref:YfhD family protein n=1 Tax=Oceanobacillus piezotolerans TaxID=2448030 RepID=A0A498D3J0_9BACI|nr:YfhD family protein [Oceanobacillus piezotolerans]RLL42030.1 YfhD family protein [Oceanobacillus piezotolerans]